MYDSDDESGGGVMIVFSADPEKQADVLGAIEYLTSALRAHQLLVTLHKRGEAASVEHRCGTPFLLWCLQLDGLPRWCVWNCATTLHIPLYVAAPNSAKHQTRLSFSSVHSYFNCNGCFSAPRWFLWQSFMSEEK